MIAVRSMLAAATACAATVAECITIGTDALRVEIDSATGRLAGIESRGRTLLADDPALPVELRPDGRGLLLDFLDSRAIDGLVDPFSVPGADVHVFHVAPIGALFQFRHISRARE